MANHPKLFRPESPRGHKIYALIFAGIMVFSLPVIGILLGEAGNVGSQAGNLTSATSDGINSMVSYVFGWNSTKWEQATLTLSSNKVSAIFPVGFAPKTVYIVTANRSFDNSKLLQQSLLYTTTSVTLSTSGNAVATLKSVSGYLGTFKNGSSTNQFDSKAIVNYVENQTIYSSTVNNLAQPLEYNVFYMYATPMASVPLYAMTLNSSANSTSAITLSFTSYLSQPFHLNLLAIAGETELAIFILSLVVVGLTMPRYRGGD